MPRALRPALRAMPAVALLALFSAAVYADIADEATVLSPIQVTAGRSERSLAEVPQAVTVIDAASIGRETPQIVTDLLRGQPGVFVQSSGPGQGIPIVRGLKGSEVLHLVDGMRLNMGFFRNSPSQYVALVDPYNLARIELLRGSGGTLYGSDALGGVLQMFTPEHRFEGDALQFSGAARALYASADLAKIGRAEFAAGRSGLSFSGGYTAMDFGAYETSRDGRQPFTAYAMRGGDAKLLWAPAAGHELMLSAQFMASPKLPRYFEIVGGPGGEGSGLPVFFEPNDRRFVHARYRIGTPTGFADQIEIHLAQQVINDDRERLVDEETRENEQNRSTLNGLTLQGITQRGALRWTYGADLYDDAIDSAKSRTSLQTLEVSTRTPTFPDGASTQDFGVYIDGEWQANARWLLLGGLRYSRIETDLTATALSPQATVSNSDVTAQLGSAFALTPALQWTANLSRGFRAPNIFDLGTLGPRPNTDPQVINVPNPGLDKETVVNLDSGFKWYREGLRVDFSLFHSWNDHRIEAREPTGNTIADGQFGCSEAQGCIEVRSENLSAARFWGIESGARLSLSSQLETYATLNYTRGEERRAGETRPANRIPPLNGQLGLVYLPVDAVRMESYLRFADRQDRLDDDDQGDTRIDPAGTAGWSTLNLRLGWTPVQELQLQLDGINLLDQAYREHGSGIDGKGVGLVAGAHYRF